MEKPFTNLLNEKISSLKVEKILDQSPPVVTVYQDEKYKGLSKSFSVGNYPQMSQYSFNDTISSIQIKSGYRCVAFEHTNYGGACRVYEGDQSSLPGFNDTISSLIVEKILDQSLPVVTVYQDEKYKGQSKSFSVGNYPQMSLYGFNDIISSIQIQSGYRCIAFEHTNYEGTSRIYEGDQLSLPGFNDTISSLKVEKIVDQLPPVVTVYQDENYKGLSKSFSVGNYPQMSQYGFNDIISSIRVQSGYRCTFYKDAYYKGDSFCVECDVSYVGRSFNDKISSLKVEKVHGSHLSTWKVTKNLVVNGDAELSAQNFPTYGWVNEEGYGGKKGIGFGAFTSIIRGNKKQSPHSGKYFFAPIQGQSGNMSRMISHLSGAPIYGLNNMPGIISGGYTPGNMPRGHVPDNMPTGMPDIPGLPCMTGKNLTNVPLMPSKIPGITGIPGIPSLPGMFGMPKANSLGIPITPILSEIIGIINWFGENAASHTDLSQTVDISLFKNYIDAGVQTINFSGYFCADDGVDKTNMFVYAIDAFGKEKKISESVQTQNINWQKHAFEKKLLPIGTRKLKIVLRVSKEFGHDYYAGGFDDIELTMPVYKLPLAISSNIVNKGSTAQITTPNITIPELTYQSMNPSIATVDDRGNVTGVKTGTTTIKVIDPVFTEIPNEISVTVIELPVIITHPANISVNVNQSAIFSVVETLTLAYRWQISINGATWVNLDNSPLYSGTNTNKLTIAGITATMNGHMFRCVLSGVSGTVYSNSATLTVI